MLHAMDNKTTCGRWESWAKSACFLAGISLGTNIGFGSGLNGSEGLRGRRARVACRSALSCNARGKLVNEKRVHHGGGACEAGVKDGRGGSRLHVVFVHPQIHWNTGNMGRTCLGLGATLHLVEPLGFSLEERQIRRAGLDYWEHVDLRVHESWEEFVKGEMREIGGTRLFFTKFGEECATRIEWPVEGNVVLVFGSEVDGFDGIRWWLEGEGRAERKVAFPMVDERFRSFNLSTTASMALWDAYKHMSVAEAGDVANVDSGAV